MAEPQLDWSTAEVHDAKLSVSLDGEAPRGWQARRRCGGRFAVCRQRAGEMVASPHLLVLGMLSD
jgi:hypothetical protein